MSTVSITNDAADDDDDDDVDPDYNDVADLDDG